MRYRRLPEYKYQLTQSVAVRASGWPPVDHPLITIVDDLIVVKAGYAWDGASGPALDTKTVLRGSLIHDALYQLIRDGFIDYAYRKPADKLFRRLCLEDGMHPLRAWWIYWAVRLFAGRTSPLRGYVW